jgi:sarcosine oxidase, subunit gamma
MPDDAALMAPALPETPRETLKGDCRIASRPAGHILQILASLSAADIASRLSGLAVGDARALRTAGPETWYVVGAAPLTPQDIAQLEMRLGPRAWVIDQTHGRARLEISGSSASSLLATGAAVDLAIGRFPIGAACETLFGHIGVHLTRTGPNNFELLVGRSFAVSLWDALTN